MSILENRNFYLEKMEQATDGSEGGSGGGGETPAAAAEAPEGSVSDPFGNFDLDAFLHYDPMKKPDEGTGSEGDIETPPAGVGGQETPSVEGAQETPPATPTSQAEGTPPTTPPTEPPAAPTPQDLELQVLRQQLAEMQKLVQGQQAQQPQAPQAQADADPELAKLYDPSTVYNQLTMPPAVAEKIFSNDPEEARQGLNTAFQGLAYIIHKNVAEQAKQREELLGQRLVAQAQQPWRQEAQARENRNLHDSFYAKYPELDKPELKPYIAMKAKQVAEQMGIQQPTQQFLDWVAQNVKQELGLGTAAAPTNPAPSAPTPPAQPTPPPYMTGNGSGRAPSKPAAKDDIFDTLFVG